MFHRPIYDDHATTIKTLTVVNMWRHQIFQSYFSHNNLSKPLSSCFCCFCSSMCAIDIANLYIYIQKRTHTCSHTLNIIVLMYFYFLYSTIMYVYQFINFLIIIIIQYDSMFFCCRSTLFEKSKKDNIEYIKKQYMTRI